MALFKPAKGSLKIPKMEEVAPRLVELKAKRAQLGAAIQPLRDEVFALGRKAIDRPTATVVSQSDAQFAQASRVAAMLGTAPPQRADSDQQRIAEIHQRLADIAAAIDVLDREIARERSVASAKICEMVAEQHNAIVRSICDTLKVVHQHNLEYHSLLEVLEDDGVTISSLSKMDVPLLTNPSGHPRDNYSDMALYFRQAKEYGIISNSDIPAELRL